MFKSYILPRLIQWAIVIFVGVTVAFVVPRFTPSDPVQYTLNQLTAMGNTNPEAMQKLEDVLKDLYGLRGNLFTQYFNFWRHLLQGDLGPSLSMFPTSVTQVIRTSLPWTAGLLLTSTLIGWGLGVLLGTLSGYFSGQPWTKVLDGIVVCLYPIPYYVMAITLVMLFAYVWPVLPLMGGAAIGVKPGLTWTFIGSAIKHGFLPAMSLLLVSVGWRYLSQRALTSTIIASDYVVYAEAAALPSHKILSSYVLRNALLPQITDLALSLGTLFGGALVTEYVFSYPGMGQVLYTAILQGDFNLMMGITIFSVIGIATAALLVDLLYPLFDPRIRYH